MAESFSHYNNTVYMMNLFMRIKFQRDLNFKLAGMVLALLSLQSFAANNNQQEWTNAISSVNNLIESMSSLNDASEDRDAENFSYTSYDMDKGSIYFEPVSVDKLNLVMVKYYSSHNSLPVSLLFAYSCAVEPTGEMLFKIDKSSKENKSRVAGFHPGDTDLWEIWKKRNDIESMSQPIAEIMCNKTIIDSQKLISAGKKFVIFKDEKPTAEEQAKLKASHKTALIIDY